MTSPQQTQCADELILRRLLAEQLQNSEEAIVLEHIETCEDCREHLADLAGNNQIEQQIRKHLIDESFTCVFGATVLEGAAEESEVENLKALLAPTDDPHMLGRVGHYEINAIIGRGSTGIVFKALDKRLNRYVAIKMLSPSFAGSGPARKRFEREARSIAAVRDEHVIPVFAVDEHNGLPFIVMEYMPAGSLAQRIEKEGSLDTCEVVRIGMQVARALDAAHAQGIVHRDVKPANVLLGTGVDRALVTDFGLARVSDEASMTRSGAISGTPQFMSPEQASGSHVDHRSDLFSLGSVMYMACTGHSPFRSETVFGVIKRVCETEPRPIRETHPEIRKWLCDFITKLHAKDVNERFQSASEVADALAEELAYLQSASQPKPPRIWRPAKQSAKQGLPPKIISGLAVTAVAACAGCFAFGLFGDSDENQQGIQEGNSASSNGSLANADPQRLVSDESELENVSPVANEVANEFALLVSDHDASVFDRGMSAFEEEDYDLALKLFTKAVESNEWRGVAEYNIACCYALKNLPDEAFEWLRKAGDAGFCDSEHYRSDDDLKSLRNDTRFPELLAEIEQEERVEELISEGILLRQQSRFDDANEAYQRALKLHPNHPHAIVEYGLSLHLQGKLDEALKWHLRAAETSDWDHYGYYNIACYHSLKGDADTAFKFFRKAIDAGMLEISHFEEDSDLDSIRGDERYEEMIQLAETKLRESWSAQEKATYRLIEAIRAENYGQIASLLKEVDPDGSIPQYRSSRSHMAQPRWTPLCEACKVGDLKAVELLVGGGASAEFMQGWEPRPLMVAAGHGEVDICKYLLERGAKIDTNLPGSGTALSFAAANNEVDSVRFLLSEGADIDSKVDGVGTALMVAARNGSIESVRLLLKRGAKLNVVQPGVGTALSHAARENEIETIKLLLEQGAEINAKVPGVGTPLSIAICSRAEDAVQFFIDRGADVNVSVDGSGTPLSMAAGCGDLTMMRLLITNNADLDVQTAGVGTALCVAARFGEIEAVRLLLESGAEPNGTAAGVGTPLACAVGREEYEVAKLLIKHGADAKATSPGNKSAIEVARWLGNEEMQQLLNASEEQ